MRVVEIQLFMQSGMLVATAQVEPPLGKMPLIVQFAGQHYVLVDGRYVAADIVQAFPSGH